MTKTLLSCLLSGVLTTLAAEPARAARTPRRPPPAKAKTYVILVGISDYADKQIKPRPNAEKDVAALYKLFTDKEYLGADPKNVQLLAGQAGRRRGREGDPGQLPQGAQVGRRGGQARRPRPLRLRRRGRPARRLGRPPLLLHGRLDVQGPRQGRRRRRGDRGRPEEAQGEAPDRLPRRELQGLRGRQGRSPSRPSARPRTRSSSATTAPTTTCPSRAGSPSWRPTA